MKGKNHASIREKVALLEEYSTLFSLLVQMPSFIAKVGPLDDHIKAVRYPTEFKTRANETYVKKVKKSLSARYTPSYVIVNNMLKGAADNQKYAIPSSGLKVETKGFWKTLALDATGTDKDGNPVQGKTWVEQTISWVEQSGLGLKAFDQSIELTVTSKETHEGYIYVMRNAQHPRDVYKIGFTLYDPYDRATALYSTSGQPDIFSVVQAWKVREPRAVEQQVHLLLKDKRVNQNREFFKEK